MRYRGGFHHGGQRGNQGGGGGRYGEGGECQGDESTKDEEVIKSEESREAKKKMLGVKRVKKDRKEGDPGKCQEQGGQGNYQEHSDSIESHQGGEGHCCFEGGQCEGQGQDESYC